MNNIKINDIKQDINFLEYPMWMQTNKINKWTDQSGYTYEAFDVPSKVDMIYLYALMLQSQNEGWQHKITISRYQLLKQCGITPCKKEYVRLAVSLKKWQSVTISFSGTFYDSHEYFTLSFGIINGWSIRKKDKKLRIRFDEVWLEKLKGSGYYKYINFEQIKKLRSPLALRLYEILCKTFYNRKKWEIDIFKLAQKIPLTEKYISHINQKIIPAVKRIREKTDLKITVEIIKTGKNQGKFIFKTKSTIKQKQLPEPVINNLISLDDDPFEFIPEHLKPLVNSTTTANRTLPEDTLKLIPEKFRSSSLSICKTIFEKYKENGFKFYIDYVNTQQNIKNYGGLLNSLLKTEPEFYEAYILDQKNKQERQAKFNKKLKLQLKKIEEIKKENEEMQDKIKNLTAEELKALDAFIDKQPLNNFNRKRFNNNQRKILRQQYITSFNKAKTLN